MDGCFKTNLYLVLAFDINCLRFARFGKILHSHQPFFEFGVGRL